MSSNSDAIGSRAVSESTSRGPLAVTYLVSTFLAGAALVYLVNPQGSVGEPGRAESGSAATKPDSVGLRIIELASASQSLAAASDETQARLDALETNVRSLQDERIALLEAQLGSVSADLRRLAEREASVATVSETSMPVAAGAEPEIDLSELETIETPEGARVALSSTELGFGSGRAELGAGATEPLTRIAAVLTAQPRLSVLVRGHTDSLGDAETNRILSERRATAVRDRLIALGVAADRLQVEGQGESSPVGDNSTSEGRDRNRRVEVFLRRL